MKAAVVHSANQVPIYSDFQSPEPQPGQHIIQVTAAALSHVTKQHASGKHYSSEDAYPLIVGVDGVGMLENGQRVYFAKPRAPYGAMAEKVAISSKQCIPLPDSIDDITAAAIAIPGMSSWIALRERAVFQTGETVLINGATGCSGILAVQIARHLGAKRIIATGRNPQTLQQLYELGADEVISLLSDELEQKMAFEKAFSGGIDIVLDYLWGASAQKILSASTTIPNASQALRFVQIGSIASDELTISAAMLRSRATVLMGSGMGSVSLSKIFMSLVDLFASANKAGFRIDTETTSLADVSNAWNRDTGNKRLVFTI